LYGKKGNAAKLLALRVPVAVWNLHAQRGETYFSTVHGIFSANSSFKSFEEGDTLAFELGRDYPFQFGNKAELGTMH